MLLSGLLILSSCDGQTSPSGAKADALQSQKIAEQMGTKYDDFRKESGFDEKKDALLFTKNEHDVLADGKQIKDEVIEFAVNKPQTYFNIPFTPYYSFSSYYGLNMFRYLGASSDSDYGLKALKDIVTSFSQNYTCDKEYSEMFGADRNISKFIEKHKDNNSEKLSEDLNNLKSSSSSLSKQWIIDNKFQGKEGHKLIVSVHYTYGLDEKTGKDSGFITVSYFVDGIFKKA